MTFQTTFDSQVIGQGPFVPLPLVTIGETIPGTTGVLNSSSAGDFQPTGILDGAGAIAIDDDTIRAFVNSELNNDDGIAYTLTNESANAGLVEGVEGTFPEFTLVGGRITYFDININTFEIEDAGLAYNTSSMLMATLLSTRPSSPSQAHSMASLMMSLSSWASPASVPAVCPPLTSSAKAAALSMTSTSRVKKMVAALTLLVARTGR